MITRAVMIMLIDSVTGMKAASTISRPPVTHILPEKRWVLRHTAGLWSVQGVRIPVK